MKEIWKKIPNEYGNYEISNYGNIRNNKNHCLSKRKQNSGYLLVHLYKNGKRKAMTVHRLTAIVFINNPRNKKYINHINANKIDNRIENLEWCTASENMQHASKNGLCYNGLWTEKRRNETSKRMSRLHKSIPKTKEHNMKNRLAHLGKIYGKHHPLKLINDKEELFFDSIRSAAKYLNINKDKLKRNIGKVFMNYNIVKL